ncbi:MAG TPA: hypothetical protein VKA13_04005 [Gammaproteobacteria bacterium]|nr:hypothetical protein [Gammaproteobacteria bacterium]
MDEPDPRTLKQSDGFVVRYQDKLRAALLLLREGLQEETEETRDMLEVYYRYTMNRATREDMRRANKQFKDLIRMMGLGILLVLPMAPVSIPLIVKLGQILGVEVMPSAYRRDRESDPDQ